MDAGAIGALVPVVMFFFGGLWLFSTTTLGKAVAKRIAGGAPPEDLERRVAELEREADAVRAEMAEAQERLDFAERALAQVKEAKRLAGG